MIHASDSCWMEPLIRSTELHASMEQHLLVCTRSLLSRLTYNGMYPPSRDVIHAGRSPAFACGPFTAHKVVTRTQAARWNLLTKHGEHLATKEARYFHQGIFALRSTGMSTKQ